MPSRSRIEIPSARCLGVGDALDGRYRLDSMIASGGMGRIFRATDLQMERDVAIKLLHPYLIDDEQAVRRFEREVHIAKSFAHPNIVQVFDYGRSRSDAFYVAMEYLEGEALATLIDRDAPLELGHTCDLLLQVLDGLAEAHDADVLHRDMKPNNIFLTDRRHGGQHVKLLDFGIAKSLGPEAVSLTGTDHACGTVSYMPPESVFQAELDKSCDVYAVGLIAAEMAMGGQIFEGDNGPQTLLRHVQEPIPVPANVAETPVGDVIRCATAKHPEERYEEAESMLEALASASEQLDRPLHPDLSETVEFWPPGRTNTNSIWPLHTSGSGALDVLRHDPAETSTGPIPSEYADAIPDEIRNALKETDAETAAESDDETTEDVVEVADDTPEPPDESAGGVRPSYAVGPVEGVFETTQSMFSTADVASSLKIPGRFELPNRTVLAAAIVLLGGFAIGWYAVAGDASSGAGAEEATRAETTVAPTQREALTNRPRVPQGGSESSPKRADDGMMVFRKSALGAIEENDDPPVDVELTPMEVTEETPPDPSAGGRNADSESADSESANSQPPEESPDGREDRAARADRSGREHTEPDPPDPSADSTAAPSGEFEPSDDSDDAAFRNVAREYALE